VPVGVALAGRTALFARQAPLRLARRLYSVNCFIFNPDALVSNKQTLYHISAAQISLNTISNGHLAFMKMTGDGSPPESSSYDGRECDRGKKGNHRRESTEWEGLPCLEDKARSSDGCVRASGTTSNVFRWYGRSRLVEVEHVFDAQGGLHIVGLLVGGSRKITSGVLGWSTRYRETGKKQKQKVKWRMEYETFDTCELRLHTSRADHSYMEELLSDWRVFIYMSTHGINLYHVEASAASVQRLLVSFWRYLANENYDLSSEGFYGTSTLVSSASCWLSRLRLYAYQTIE
ncbi:hypothetical protein ALC57_13978, partial [Trachymyrmex cornetzi]